MSNPLLTLAASVARALPAPARRGLYRLGPFTRLLRGLLNRSAPTGPTEVTITAGALQGARMLLDLQTEKAYWLGTYETDLQTAIQDWVTPGMTAYDVGANIGYLSLMLARAVGKTGQVFAFEALPANFERLQKNLALQYPVSSIQYSVFSNQYPVTSNQHPTPICAIHAAVVDAAGQVRFHLHRSTGMGKAAGSAGRKEEYTGHITVPGISLDHFVFELGNPAPDVVKMDIEGGEVLALPGMRRVLAEARPLLFLELHGQQAAATAWQLLTGSGYHLHHLKSGYPPIRDLENLGWKAYLLAKPA